jgi:AbrB family looped-hinge helix DNA binding protein
MLDKRGRLVIPLEMRTAMGMPKGGRLDWRVENGEIILRRVREGRSDA